MTSRITVEKLIRETDSLTYLNALKTAISELKEELALVEETGEYQAHAIDRAKKIMRRIDNQYRAIIKSTAKLYNPPGVDIRAGLGLANIEQELAEDD